MKQESQTLAPESLRKIDAYWRAANYLSVGQIYPHDNPLLKSHSRWPTSSRACRVIGARLQDSISIYVHPNRVIRQHDSSVIYITGPGHGAPAPRGSKASSSAT